jgi:hypothetical protein
MSPSSEAKSLLYEICSSAVSETHDNQ